jgi:hypothetical protein
MSIIKLLTASAMIAIISGCVTTPSAKVNFDKNTDIDTVNYKTFAWLTKGKIMASPVDINPVMKVRVDKNIEQAFIAKGYKLAETPESADFTISYTIGSRDKIKVNNYPAGYKTAFGWGRSYYGGHMYMGNETNVRQYTEGKLAIDVYDVKSHQPVWHGWATKRLRSNDKESPSKALNEIVVQVVNQFN